MGRSARHRHAGLSLVEVLVALAVFALLAAAAVGVLAWAAGQQGAVRARMDRIAELQRAHALLQADLGQVVLRRVRDADGQLSRNAFRAAPPDDRRLPLLGFVRGGWDNPDAAPRPSLQYVEYQLVRDRLERRTRPALDGTEPGPPQVVLAGVRAVRTGFYSHRQWSDGWTGGATALPQAVMVEVELADLGTVRQLFLLPGVE